MKRPRPSRLKARKVEGNRRYRKHLVDTQGLGIRDLCLDGNDMLVLVGTPLASDGPSRVLRWHNAVYDTHSGVVDGDRLSSSWSYPIKVIVTIRKASISSNSPVAQGGGCLWPTTVLRMIVWVVDRPA